MVPTGQCKDLDVDSKLWICIILITTDSEFEILPAQTSTLNTQLYCNLSISLTLCHSSFWHQVLHLHNLPMWRWILLTHEGSVDIGGVDAKALVVKLPVRLKPSSAVEVLTIRKVLRLCDYLVRVWVSISASSVQIHITEIVPLALGVDIKKAKNDVANGLQLDSPPVDVKVPPTADPSESIGAIHPDGEHTQPSDLLVHFDTSSSGTARPSYYRPFDANTHLEFFIRLRICIQDCH